MVRTLVVDWWFDPDLKLTRFVGTGIVIQVLSAILNRTSICHY